LKEKVTDFFDIDCESPYMLLVAPIKEGIRCKTSNNQEKFFGLDKLNVVRSTIPAVTHVDYSARVQTVDERTNPLYYKMIKKFNQKYGCPVVINTSFNVRGEPIVCTPEDAYLCFAKTNMDYLIIGNCLIEKKEQKPLDKDSEYLKQFNLD